MVNFVLLKKNKIYEEIYDLLEDDDLFMNNKDHYDKIKYRINKYVSTHKSIILSEEFDKQEDMFEELMVKITNNSEDTNIQGNTIFAFASDDDLYELVYMEDLVTQSHATNDNLNQLASMSNNDLEPLFGSCGLIRTIYDVKTSTYVNKSISITDVSNLVMANFYHSGVIINQDGEMLELVFSGDNPNMIIGTGFMKMDPINVFGLTIVGYIEEKPISNKLNEVASNLYGREINARVFFTMLCPLTNKKYSDITIQTIKRILKILSYEKTDMEKINMLNAELSGDKVKNPFFLLKKYSV
jgi:hypothetical protein